MPHPDFSDVIKPGPPLCSPTGILTHWLAQTETATLRVKGAPAFRVTVEFAEQTADGFVRQTVESFSLSAALREVARVLVKRHQWHMAVGFSD